MGKDRPLLHGVHVADEQPELHGAGLPFAAGAGREQQVVAGDAQSALHRRLPRARQQHALHRRRFDQLGELHGGWREKGEIVSGTARLEPPHPPVPPRSAASSVPFASSPKACAASSLQSCAGFLPSTAVTAVGKLRQRLGGLWVPRRRARCGLGGSGGTWGGLGRLPPHIGSVLRGGRRRRKRGERGGGRREEEEGAVSGSHGAPQPPPPTPACGSAAPGGDERGTSGGQTGGTQGAGPRRNGAAGGGLRWPRRWMRGGGVNKGTRGGVTAGSTRVCSPAQGATGAARGRGTAAGVEGLRTALRPPGRRTPGFHLKARSAWPSRSCQRPPPPRGPRTPPRRHAELLASLPSPFF